MLGVYVQVHTEEITPIALSDSAAFCNRTLGHVAFPYVYLDATYINVRDDALGQVVSRAVVIAAGITADGRREVLGVDIGDSEDETFWTRFLRSLKDRGLGGVRLVISDAHAGLKASIRRCFNGASWQRSSVNIGREREVPARCLHRRERTLAA
jgi:putative transposase